MIFNSLTFLVFFSIVFVVYAMTKGRNRLLICLASSYVFYGWWDWRFLGLILFSTIVDYLVGISLESSEDQRKRKALLALSIATNLGLLGIFKYANFFIDSANAMLLTAGLGSWSSLDIVLPVGISFYTFQTMSYSIDVYRREIPCERSLLKFATYVAFFPQLVAGPIVRARDLLPQFQTDQPVTFGRFRYGIGLVTVGLFKKVCVADSLAHVVDYAFADPMRMTSVGMTLAIIFYAFQIYCDFSGYSDIAIGVAHTLGFDFPVNFRMPYFSSSFSEFWQRWHISLSQWLRDYLYIPPGGTRHGFVATSRNLMITMLLGGLWHGASWNFVVWGALHGAFLIVQRVFGGWLSKRSALAESGIGKLISMAFVFALTCVAWVFFRCHTFADAIDVLGVVATNGIWHPASIPHKVFVAKGLLLIGLLVSGELIACWRPAFMKWIVERPAMSLLAYSLAAGCILFFGTFDGNQFIYFQF